MDNETLYIKGFNHGYLLSQHEPELLQQILQSPIRDNGYFECLITGHKEYEMEKNKQHSIGKPQISHSKDDKDIAREK